MSVLSAIVRELRDARCQARPVLFVRVTASAIRGTVAAVPISPERARTIRLRDLPGGTVTADPEVVLRSLEILVHPEDWIDLLAAPEARYAILPGEPTRVLGLPVY